MFYISGVFNAGFYPREGVKAKSQDSSQIEEQTSSKTEKFDLDFFKHDLFARALEYGMSADEYWFGDPNMIFAFQQAYMSKEKLALQKLWQQGLYFARAIQCTIHLGKGKPPEYPQMPFIEELTEQQMGNKNYRKICYENRRAKLKQIFECHKKK